MTAQEMMELARRAREEGSFRPLFLAEEGFVIPPDRSVPVDIPTDWSLVVQNGLYSLYESTRDAQIPSLCAADLRILFRGGAYCVWCAYNVFFYLLCAEREGRAPFAVVDGALLQDLRDALLRTKEALESAKIWLGRQSPLGLWGQIAGSLKSLETRFGLALALDGGEPMKELVRRLLQNYFERTRRETGSAPRAVRRAGMDVPRFTVEPGRFGDWEPEEASCALAPETLARIFGEPVHPELYAYYRDWRFAALEFTWHGRMCAMDPIYETVPNQTNFFFSMKLFGELYFKLGIAEGDGADGEENTILFRNAGGVYLLRGGSRTPRRAAPDLRRFLTEGR